MKQPERTTILIGGTPVGDATITVENKIERRDQLFVGRFGPTLVASPFSATVSIKAPYGMLVPDQYYTVETTLDFNPWHRQVSGWKLFKKIVDGVVWTFRKRVLKHYLVDKATMTVPDCQLVNPDV